MSLDYVITSNVLVGQELAGPDLPPGSAVVGTVQTRPACKGALLHLDSGRLVGYIGGLMFDIEKGVENV